MRLKLSQPSLAGVGAGAELGNRKKSQHDCGRWVPHLTPPYSDFAWAGLKDIWFIMKKSMHNDEGGDRTTHKGRG